MPVGPVPFVDRVQLGLSYPNVRKYAFQGSLKVEAAFVQPYYSYTQRVQLYDYHDLAQGKLAFALVHPLPY